MERISFFNLDGELKKFGFQTTKFVEAKKPQKAEKIAVILQVNMFQHINYNERKR